MYAGCRTIGGRELWVLRAYAPRQLTVEEVISLINKTKGGQFEIAEHHSIGGLKIYKFKPDGWYIKCYFIEPDIFFISVHR